MDKEDALTVLNCTTANIEEAACMYAETNGLDEAEVRKQCYNNIGSMMTDQAAVNKKFVRGLNLKRKQELTNMDTDENIADLQPHNCQMHFDINLAPKTNDAIFKYENNNENISATNDVCSKLYTAIGQISHTISSSPSDKYSLKKLWDGAVKGAPKTHLKMTIKRINHNRAMIYINNALCMYWHLKQGSFATFLKMVDVKIQTKPMNEPNNQIIAYIRNITSCKRMIGAMRAVAIVNIFVIQCFRTSRSGKCSMLDAALTVRDMQQYFEMWQEDATKLSAGTDKYVEERLSHKSSEEREEIENLLFIDEDEALELIFTLYACFNRLVNILSA